MGGERAKKLAEEIELTHRKADVTMGVKYQQDVVNYIEMLQKLSKVPR